MKKKRFLILFLMAGLTIVLLVSPAMAEQFTVFGRPGRIMGYISQGGSFSLDDKDKYDTEKGLNSALTNLFVEGDYAITDNLKFYGSSMLTVDWIYQLKANDSSWNEKLFNKSRDRLNVDNKPWQLLKEAHLTWTPGNFMFRVGKQIVAWGETDAFRIVDQINPADQRRGLADVEWETSIIPIWLVRAEYSLKQKPSWLQDLGFEFIWNPNPDFISNQPVKFGNDVGGIWSPNYYVAGSFPFGEAHLGSMYTAIEKPKNWSSEGFEYGFRIKGVVKDAIITLNYFYGRDNDPVVVSSSVPFGPVITMASDGRLIIHPSFVGKFPILHFVGATFSRDIPLSASFLGGVSPVLRLETLYAFDTTFGTSLGTFEKHDEFRGAIGVDWKVKIPFLNPRAYFSISPQLYYRKVMNYPAGYGLTPPCWPPDQVPDLSTTPQSNNYATSLMIGTTYFHNKLAPSFFWMHSINNNADFFRLQLNYDYNDNWRFTLGSIFLTGNQVGRGFQCLDNKDYAFFKVTYKFN